MATTLTPSQGVLIATALRTYAASCETDAETLRAYPETQRTADAFARWAVDSRQLAELIDDCAELTVTGWAEYVAR